MSAGGAFLLPRLGVSIPPRAGRAFLWPHLRDDDMLTPDERTEHTSAPVEEGTKYGAVRAAAAPGTPPRRSVVCDSPLTEGELRALRHPAKLDIRAYDMEAAPLERDGGYLALHVPGLSENRPSVLRGDCVSHPGG